MVKSTKHNNDKYNGLIIKFRQKASEGAPNTSIVIDLLRSSIDHNDLSVSNVEHAVGMSMSALEKIFSSVSTEVEHYERMELDFQGEPEPTLPQDIQKALVNALTNIHG